MVSTAIASEMSSAIRVLETRRARIARDVQVPTAQVLSWIAFALRNSSVLFDREARDAGIEPGEGYAIVDRHLTRC